VSKPSGSQTNKIIVHEILWLAMHGELQNFALKLVENTLYVTLTVSIGPSHLKRQGICFSCMLLSPL